MANHTPHHDDEKRAVQRTPVEARQGSRNRANLRVLILSFGIAVLVLAILYLSFSPSSYE